MTHGIWKGTLGFGLVSIGVELFSAESPGGISLDLLDKRDHAAVGYRKYNKSTGAEIESSDIVKGYAVSKGKYVVLSDQDLHEANPTSTRTIDVLGFVDAGSIQTIYFDKPYIVAPLKGSEKAYALFVRTLEDTERIGIAQIVIRTAEHVAAVYPYRQAIVVHLLRYDSEVRVPSELGVTEDSMARRGIRATEMTMARQLVASMATTWDPSDFKDRYHDDLLRLIAARAAGGVPVTVASVDSDAPRVLDLMAALKSSLAARAPSGGRKVRRTTTLRRPTVVKATKKPPAKSVKKHRRSA